MDWINIGGRIRRQREFLGYTREDLAEKIDVTTKFCSDIELGLKGMSVPTLCRISAVLGISVDYILFGEAKETAESPAVEMIRKCPAEKLVYLENIVKEFTRAVQ